MQDALVFMFIVFDVCSFVSKLVRERVMRSAAKERNPYEKKQLLLYHTCWLDINHKYVSVCLLEK